ncbi:MAG: hypothetical protein N3E48_02220 [Candidatus Bathyarchaeota archaeon]|nr:hypothetical protein [Candidatus Bathyarchaeota archaeon]
MIAPWAIHFTFVVVVVRYFKNSKHDGEFVVYWTCVVLCRIEVNPYKGDDRCSSIGLPANVM